MILNYLKINKMENATPYDYYLPLKKEKTHLENCIEFHLLEVTAVYPSDTYQHTLEDEMYMDEIYCEILPQINEKLESITPLYELYKDKINAFKREIREGYTNYIMNPKRVERIMYENNLEFSETMEKVLEELLFMDETENNEHIEEENEANEAD
jgi:hypothetical protein